jgi:SAM-dependent methyltransferase
VIRFACPLCRGDVAEDEEAWACGACGRRFIPQHGIPDFRVFPDPYLGFEQDRERAEAVVAALDRHDLAGLLQHYWSLSDTTPRGFRERFALNALRAEGKARRVLGLLEDQDLAASGGRVLEIGSGSGGLLSLASRRFKEVVGLDIAMRWLHLSRRRFMDRCRPIPTLVCACAEHLPFPDGSFDLVVLAATLECTRDPERVLAECRRVLTDTGCLYINAANRFSLAPEPRVRLWGVGFLPRRWQAPYVRWRRKTPFEVQLPSFWSLDRMTRRHFPRRSFVPADVDDETVNALPPARRLQVVAYRCARRFAILRVLLMWFGPEWDIVLRKA